MAEIQPVWRGDNATKVDFVIGPATLKLAALLKKDSWKVPGVFFCITKNDGIVNIGSHSQSGLQRAFKKPQIRSQLLFTILNLTALSERQADQMKNVEHIGRTC